ncbi:hypothetical protein M406DRAFT_252003 [Cryphonectria parasitica EP155]|uniref:Polyketide synthase n=1 Tax=Cryphonectria parasitica (strain ATCC 38755 / EP155) TaxID=660469 RepID=A0A9P4Y4Z7_CRYP1|nr:uncharacterized protein M406DRAFT_252003 [Cryphonectria parasitica EP155]KAF3766643.1 hypothetical protein M406DRAFT_252003 [Cryphonectria parasitica EP155]
MTHTVSSGTEPIAIVGSGCRFPGSAHSRSSLWSLLENPQDLCREISADRFSTTGFYHHDGGRHGTTNVRHSYLLDEDVRVFDAPFFNISPNEAEAMDPQQRLLLEIVYEALEAGGHTLEGLRGSDTSVYVGTMTVDYLDTLLRDHNTIPKYFATGINRAIISNRVSYFFDWHGPSMTIDTACSSSLIAVHQGVQSLRSGESRVSVACGTQVLLGYDMYIGESKLKMLSPNGRSRMWDEDADGYARGEGVAAIVMKRLSDAIADGDHIECIIRETGANQDGFSNGLTVPSSEAQAALIRQTYAKAGLDPEKKIDQPQYFEAHGTGTQAGDPREAAAIHKAFGLSQNRGRDALYVGSIKTIVGHLEGAAGLAGLLKASLGLQKGLIPANLHFNRLNPKIEPVYQGLQVPTRLTEWPELPEGGRRRVSVNSFGFGGANAHAILEEHVNVDLPPSAARSTLEGLSLRPFTPFVFSANSEMSLITLLERYSDSLKTHHSDTDASDLAWTLHSRRSQLPVKVSFSALSIKQLTDKIDVKLATVKANAATTIGTRTASRHAESCILGIFTGQGAQWPAMGASLIRSSAFVRQRVQDLEESLATLPSADRPGWSLRHEMLAGSETSRIAEAALSQPLCTAIQIVLVDLLRAAGITFAAVVGHSSGEIAAAYAAGFFSAHDAIRIAYYRGLYARLAGNKATGQQGAMLAVGTSLQDAQDLVNLQAFKGRLTVAAHNSTASVTLSGDADAIVHAKKILDKQKKFARLLKVDTAYHSHHMLPCGDSYIRALRTCGIRVNRERNTACAWFSSVNPTAHGMEPSDDLRDIYWRDNMANTVLFADAIKNALASKEHINIALEIGPHPALKGPATQNIADVRPTPLPYSGVLSRGNDDIEVFSDALGFLWTLLGPQAVDLQCFDKVVGESTKPHKLVYDLPSYPWDHGRVHWSESRRSRKIRERKQAPHELLGVLCPESNGHDMRWSNVLKVSEIAWLEGHQLQGIAVFPASGYVSMALEACRVLSGEQSIQLLELHNLSISRAITFEKDDQSGVETLTTLTSIERHADQTVTANFSVYAAQNASITLNHDHELVASASVRISIGASGTAALPDTSAAIEDYNMTEVNADRVYTTFSKLGYGYTGSFRGMSSMKRKLNHASALVDTYAYAEDDTTFYLVHPSTLDVAIQSAMLAYSSPGDQRLWSLHVPTNIGAISVNPEVCASVPLSGSRVPIFTTLDNDPENFSANIDVFSEDGQQSMIQVEDLILRPFAPATEAEDRWMYSYTKLDVAVPDASSLVGLGLSIPSARETELAVACERISFYYLRKWKAEIAHDEWENSQPYYRHVREFIEHTLSLTSAGQHATLKKAWINDSSQDIDAMISRFPGDPTINLISAVGDRFPGALRAQTTPLEEHFDPGLLLSEYYNNGLGMAEYHSLLAGMVEKITHRYPHAKILEIGAGTGAATRSIYEAISTRGGAMPYYTFTDPSQDAIKKAAAAFDKYGDNMTFKTLDMTQVPVSQGYEEHSYDVIVASNVLSATASLLESLKNTRQLLKPGGYLVLLEVTNNDPIRFTTIMGGLPAWWLGVQEGRKYAPTIAPGVWHTTLRKAGFGGIDTITPRTGGPSLAWPFSVMTVQAVDEQVLYLRRPLSSSPHVFINNLVIMGTQTLESAWIAEGLSDSLGRFCGTITILEGLPTEAEAQALGTMGTFVNLVDLDSPIFKNLTSDTMEGLKRVLDLARHVLWLVRGSQSSEEAYHEASLAFVRSLSNEAAHINFNTLHISGVDGNISRTIAEQLLRQVALEERDPRQLLWSKEPETFLRDGKLLIPRILPNLNQNARLNACRRVITKKAPVTTSNFSIDLGSSALLPSLVEDVLPRKPSLDDQKDLLRVECSSLAALHASPDTFVFLSIGKPGPTAQLVLSASTTNSHKTAPIVSVPVPVQVSDEAFDADRVLIAVTSEVFAMSLVRHLAPGSSILVHCSERDRFFAAALSRLATTHSIRVTFSCVAYQAESLEKAWIRLSARASSHAVRRRLLPVQPTHFLDLTAPRYSGVHPTSDACLNIVKALPSECSVLDPSILSRRQASLLPSFDRAVLVTHLQDAIAGVKASLNTVPCLQETRFQDIVLPLDQLTDRLGDHGTTTVLKWPADGQVELKVRPMDGRHLFFKDKTYVLFGLSGQVGQSLCEWMVSNGAGCVCLTSRRPNVDQRWLDSFQGTKATVKVFAADITDRDSLDSVLRTIRRTCPMIAGVVNGANVLSDTPFDSMSTEMMLRALGPKIGGSNNLDEAFYHDDLDFFILFSSISRVIGTAGQSNYTAANGYMNGLARQRRRRGLAASALDIGLILGIGVAEVAGQHVVDSLQKYGITPLSESDLRLAFAESIYAGHATMQDKEPGALPAAGMTSGLRTITADETDMVWYGNPVFSHLVIENRGEDTGNESKKKAATVPIWDQMAAAATMEVASEILKESFLAKLRVVLHSTDQDNIASDAPLVELGIDSLVAVEVRSWFLKTLKVDIPVLKLVGGSSLDEICEMALKKLPGDLVAQIGNSRGGGDAAAAVGVGATPPKPVASSQTPAASKSMSSSIEASNSGSDCENASASQKSASAVNTPTSAITPQTSLPSLRSAHKDNSAATKFVKSRPISVGQSRFWFLRLLVQDRTTFNVALKFRLEGNVRVGDLERALRVVTARHESLRTCFVEDEDEADQAFQKVSARSTLRLEHMTVSSVEEVAAVYAQLRAHEFDLGSGPLLRLMLISLSPTHHYLLVNYHHIIMDMASFQIFTAELEKAYNSQPLGPPPMQYPDFSVAQWQEIENGELADELEYWRGVFPAGEQPPVLPLLPMARSNSRITMTDYAVHQVGIQLDASLAEQIKLSRAQRCTPFHFYLAAFKTMLFSFTDIQDLTIGIADANRNNGDVMGSIGLFLNLLPLRFQRKSQQAFVDAMVEARDTAYGALEHSQLPFDVLLKELGVARSPSYSPFFQAFFDYRKQTTDREVWCDCEFRLDEMHPGRSAYDISLDVADLGSNVHVTVRVQQGLYSLTAANLLLETYVHLLSALAKNTTLSLDDTPLFSEKQLAQAVQVGVGTDLISDWPATLPHRIDQVAQENGDKTALLDGHGSCLTYTAMSRRIQALAEAMIRANLGRGSRVLVFQDASTDWICSMLAIMRIGGVYVPLDLRNPISRLAAQADHCNPGAVLADSTTIADAPQLNAPIIIDISKVSYAPSAHIANSADSEAAAAILYTSGSTGTPKGIMIRHAGIRNEMEGYTKTYKLGAEAVLQQSAFTFDFSIDQIFTGLVNGGRVYVVPWSKRGDPLSITEIMQQQSITYTKVTPSEYSMWLQYGGHNLRQASEWRFAFGGGEPMTRSVLRQFSELGLGQLCLYNSYGPAEISIASHKGYIDYRGEALGTTPDDGPVACGFSLPNYATYILDENQKPLPVGMPGEIAIGGAGVSLGYLTNQELTSRTFVTNPFATDWQRANGWTRMHRTGDIGHLDENGCLIFRNRIAGDTQVKLRGLRIDLGDIETNIVSAAGGALKEAVVTLRQGDPDYLVAHVVFTPGRQDVGDRDAFLTQLLSHLPIPQYMVPVLAISLDKLPLTSHSKVDRKAIRELPLPKRVPSVHSALDDDNDTGETTETMIQLRHVWRQLLPSSERLGLAITPSTSFFLVGGNSLLAIRLQSRIRDVFNVALRLVDLLGAHTLDQMARKIKESPSVGPIDWEHETAPPSTPDFLRGLPAPVNQTGGKTILMTGATGNLARHLFQLLLADARVAKIHCVAVRDKQRQEWPLPDPKVVTHVGDLSLPMLGLGMDGFRTLAEQVDVVLHLGAVRSFFDDYYTLRASNVFPTKELVKLASARRIPIHFLSTAGVLPPEGSLEEAACSAAAYVPPSDGSEGYVATKWASEHVLERAASASDLAVPSFIYRMLPLSAAGTQPELLKQQALDEFARCIDLAGVVPDPEGWAGRMDLIPADLAARWLCESVLTSQLAEPATTKPRFLHYESPAAVEVDELMAHVELTVQRRRRKGEKELTTIPLLKWLGRIKALGFGYVLASHEATMQSDEGKLVSRR